MNANLNFRNYKLNIPFSGIEKKMLLVQFGFGIDSDITDKDFLFTIQRYVYSRLNDLLPVITLLPDNATILDIGSGNSLIDLAICLIFSEKNFKFILVDDSDTFLSSNEKNSEFYDETNYKTYNNWSFVNKVINSNGFIRENFICKSPSEIWTTSEVDLVVSTASWCWHYPVDTYLNKVSNIIKDGGYLYINSVLNIDNAIDKLLVLCPNVLKKTLKQYQEAFSTEEQNKINTLINEGRVSRNEFKYLFLGKSSKV